MKFLSKLFQKKLPKCELEPTVETVPSPKSELKRTASVYPSFPETAKINNGKN